MIIEAEVQADVWLPTSGPGGRKKRTYERENSKTIASLDGCLLVLHAVCGLFILWLLLKLVPGYEKIFKDFNAKLPEMTIMVINLSAWFGRFWYLLVPGLAAGDIAIMLSLNRRGRTGLMTTLGVLVWLAEILLAGLILQATMVPLNDLIVNLLAGSRGII